MGNINQEKTVNKKSENIILYLVFEKLWRFCKNLNWVYLHMYICFYICIKWKCTGVYNRKQGQEQEVIRKTYQEINRSFLHSRKHTICNRHSVLEVTYLGQGRGIIVGGVFLSSQATGKVFSTEYAKYSKF